MLPTGASPGSSREHSARSGSSEGSSDGGTRKGKARMMDSVPQPPGCFDADLARLEQEEEAERAAAVSLMCEADRCLAEELQTRLRAASPPASRLRLVDGCWVGPRVADGFVLESMGGSARGDAAWEEDLGQLAACIKTVSTPSMLQAYSHRLRVLAAARPVAVSRSITFVANMIKGAPPTLSDEVVVCGCPVRSFNEWGIAQDRILVLTTVGLWRVDFSEPWHKVDHHSRIELSTVTGIVERGGQGGFVIELSKRDGRTNPIAGKLSALKAAVPRSPRAASSPVIHTTRYTRTYAVVAVPGEPVAPLREIFVSALRACCHLGTAASRARFPNSSSEVATELGCTTSPEPAELC